MQRKIKSFLSVLLGMILGLTCFAACASDGNVPVSLSLSQMQTEFELGEAFSADGIVVTVEMEDGTSRQASSDEYTVDFSAYNADTEGTYDIMVSLNGFSVMRSYSVTVVKNTEPVSITLDPMKTKFSYGEKFTSEGLSVIVNMSDGTTRRAKKPEIECDSSSYRADVAADYEIVVTLKGYDIRASYRVTVEPERVITWKDDGALKILTIGNSFSDDAMQYVWQIADSLGIEEIVLGNLYIGGCSLDTHANNALSDAAAYEYRQNTDGTWRTTPNYRMSDAISSQNWDYISLQQASGSSGQANTYSRLGELVDYVKSLNDTAQLVWHMTWAYQQNSNHAEFSKYDRSQQKMYEMIVSTVQSEILPSNDFSVVIPNGTAIQNARTSFIGDNLTRDGYHLTLDTGRYIAGLTLVQMLTGISVENIAYSPVSAEYKAVAIESAVNACKTPYSITPSRYYK